MSALDCLLDMLKDSGKPEFSLRIGGDLPKTISALEKRYKAGTVFNDTDDLILRSVSRFRQTLKFESHREAQRVCHGLTMRSSDTQSCLMEDRQGFLAVLDKHSGIGQWLSQPRAFRRCYKGLVATYFDYDGRSPQMPATGRKNWDDLRDYLHGHVGRIQAGQFNPDWVGVAARCRAVFTTDPCAPFAQAALAGELQALDAMTRELSIGRDSWFQWELIVAQVRHAIGLSDPGFVALIPNLIVLIEGNQVVRDTALISILDRYGACAQPVLHAQLRDVSVAWWDNPWLPSSQLRWRGVREDTRQLVAEWLRGEFIEAFFTKLAKDGVGDGRRANFWLRYLKSMSDVRFGLGATAMSSRNRDFMTLREKMKGLFTRLDDPIADNNAFIMTIGNLVAVEFGGQSNAFYGYDSRRALPFRYDQPLQVPVDARNSLKHHAPVRVLRMRHQDGIHGFDTWEEWFAQELKDKFGILPDGMAMPYRAPIRAPARVPSLSSNAAPSTSRAREVSPVPDELRELASARNLRLEDLRPSNGNLWVRADSDDPVLNRRLKQLGFGFKPGKGWWKQ